MLEIKIILLCFRVLMYIQFGLVYISQSWHSIILITLFPLVENVGGNMRRKWIIHMVFMHCISEETIKHVEK